MTRAPFGYGTLVAAGFGGLIRIQLDILRFSAHLVVDEIGD
jgi:hypothetical protein